MVEIATVSSYVRTVKFLPTVQERAAENIMAIVFLNSKVFRGDVGITTDVINMFRYNTDLRESLNAFYEADQASDGETAGNSTTQSNFHKVLADTISKHRSLFPSEEFTIRTDVAGGGTLETVIPAASSLSPSSSSSAVSLLSALFGTGGTSGTTASMSTVNRAYGT